MKKSIIATLAVLPLLVLTSCGEKSQADKLQEQGYTSIDKSEATQILQGLVGNLDDLINYSTQTSFTVVVKDGGNELNANVELDEAAKYVHAYVTVSDVKENLYVFEEGEKTVVACDLPSTKFFIKLDKKFDYSALRAYFTSTQLGLTPYLGVASALGFLPNDFEIEGVKSFNLTDLMSQLISEVNSTSSQNLVILQNGEGNFFIRVNDAEDSNEYLELGIENNLFSYLSVVDNDSTIAIRVNPNTTFDVTKPDYSSWTDYTAMANIAIKAMETVTSAAGQ